MYCPKCSQQQVSDDIRFCPRCGFQLDAVKGLFAENQHGLATAEAYDCLLVVPCGISTSTQTTAPGLQL